MRGVIADVVLAAQFVGDFIQNLLDLIAAAVGPGSGQQPCLSAACIRECVKHVHVDGVRVYRTSPLLEFFIWPTSGDRKWERSATRKRYRDAHSATRTARWRSPRGPAARTSRILASRIWIRLGAAFRQ